MLNKSVKDILANPVDINTYWINKLANWHSGVAYVAEGRNDQADTYKAAFSVRCEDEEHVSMENDVLFATFLSTS
jgi:iron-sulfur cluster repair protein YtfE (RIC family)